MYTMSSGKNEKIINVLEKYRTTSSINFSDIVEDRTIYDQTRTEATFDPAQEISGRLSTWENDQSTMEPDINPDAVSVDDILCNSIVQEIRHLHQSRASTSIRNSMPFGLSTSQFPLRSDDISCASADFRPAEEMHEQLNKDERSWAQEYADIPQSNNDSMSMTDTVSKTLPKLHAKLANMTDFSMAYLGDSLSGNTDMSIGRYFSNRCQDIREMIPTRSPTKHIPMALVPNPGQSADADSESNSQASSSFFADDESNSGAVRRISSNTYNRETSVISVSTIASHLENDSPRSFVDKLFKNKAKPLTKSNVQLLEKTLSQNAQTSSRLEVEKQTKHQEHRMYEPPNNEAEGMLSRMNSTKIEEQTNEWRQWNGTASAETESLENGMSSSNMTIGSKCSPIKNQLSPPQKPLGMNCGKNKRGRSPNPVQQSGIHSSKTDQNFSQKENTENQHAQSNRIPRRLRTPGKEPLDDVSSLMNNLRILSPPTREASKSPKQPAMVRKCETDLKPIESRTIDDQRRYATQNRTSDLAKLSLPSYGLQGLRASYQSSANPIDKRCNSQLSSHSEFSQQDGKFPLKSNTSELVWECVKLRKSVTKWFVIKNTSEKKLGMKIVVVGPGFQIASGIETDSIVLQGHECRTINVAFCPTIIGKAIGKIMFKPTKNWSEETERSVSLWAYGGSTTLQLQGIERGPVGCSFLKMGETSSITSTTLKRSFSIYNKGPLNGVATIFIKPKTNQCINESNIIIEPNKCVIRPDCSATISVSYKLRRKDLERLREPSCEVFTIGTLEVIFGSEPNRQRIATMLTRRGTIPSAYKQLEFLVNDFPVASIENFNDFREHIDNVSELFGCFKTSEIALTINRTNLDETQDADLSGMDESVLFRTIIETNKLE